MNNYELNDTLNDEFITLLKQSYEKISSELHVKSGTEIPYSVFVLNMMAYSMTTFVAIAPSNEKAFKVIQETFEMVKQAAGNLDEK